MKNLKTDPKLNAALEEAAKKYASMTPTEQDAMWQAQKESYVRGEMAIGSDADEAEASARLTTPSLHE